jgi:hypothetical protein
MISRGVWHFSMRHFSQAREGERTSLHNSAIDERGANARPKCHRRKSYLYLKVSWAFRIHMVISVICAFLIVSDNVSA